MDGTIKIKPIWWKKKEKVVSAESVFIETFKNINGLTQLTFSELVALSVPFPENLLPDDIVGKTPKQLFSILEGMYRPLSAPIKEPTFYQLLRQNLQDVGYVKCIDGDEKKVRRKYLTTHKGRLQLQISTVELCMPGRLDTVDHAMFLINSAIFWKETVSYKLISSKHLNTFFGFLGLAGVETLILGMDPERASKKAHKLFLKNLSRAGLIEDEVIFSRLSSFNTLSKRVLSNHTTNIAFYRNRLKDYRNYFLGSTEMLSGIRMNPDIREAFEIVKYNSFSEMCNKALDLLEKQGG